MCAAPGKPPTPLSESAHPRTFRTNTFVYPVLSRRSGGVSVGVNLNPDKACNFDCIYCQVDRSKKPPEVFVQLDPFEAELRGVLEGLKPGGWLWSEPEFASLPEAKRRVTDIAFSGDGEPTTFRNFSEVVRRAVGVKEVLGFGAAKTVLITNATGLDRPDVQTGLALMDTHNGEIWAKLDAGTEAYFKTIDRTDFPLARVLGNILSCARVRQIVIQSCFMRLNGIGPSDAEISAYISRLNELKQGGAKIARVQVYTVARNPAYGMVSSLPDGEVDRIAARVRQDAGLPAESFYGSVPEGRGTLAKDPDSNG